MLMPNQIGLWNTMPFAYKALQAEDKIGTMLPCNVIVQEKVAGQVEVSAVDPSASMLSIENKDLHGKSNAHKRFY